MAEGEAEIDMASLDPKRHDWMTTEYAARKNEECYEYVYSHHPDEERVAAVPCARHRPMTDKALGAQFVSGRFERPNYFGPLDAKDNFDMRRGVAVAGGMLWKKQRQFVKALVSSMRHPSPNIS